MLKLSRATGPGLELLRLSGGTRRLHGVRACHPSSLLSGVVKFAFYRNAVHTCHRWPSECHANARTS